MRAFFEFLFLTFWIFPGVVWFAVREEKKIRKLFYKKTEFKEVDKFFRKLYLLKSSYSIYKKYMKSKGSSALDSYGETPLTVFHEIFQKGDLSQEDCFVDLGSGRGRGVFFAATQWACHAIGVERVPYFCEKAQKISLLIQAKKTQFFCEEIGSFDLTLGTFFYFYAICMEEEELKLSILHLEKIRPGSKLVTVSFPLTDYSDSFSLLSSWESTYPWGTAELFLHVRNS